MSTWIKKAIKEFDRKKFKDGDLISHHFLAYALNVDQEDSSSFMFRVERFKEYLLTERKIYLKSVYGKGYLIIPPDEQVTEAITELMRLINVGFMKSKKIATHVRVLEITLKIIN